MQSTTMQKRDADAPTKQLPPRMVSLMEEKSDSLKRSHSEDTEDSRNSKRLRADPSVSTAEKKRLREKKRRDEINKGFDELMSLILEIDPRLRMEADNWAKTSSSSILGGKEENLLTRGDLMAHTSKLLRRLYSENEENKRTIAGLRGLTNQRMAPNRSVSVGAPPSRTVSLGPTRTASIQRHPSRAMPAVSESVYGSQQRLADNEQQYLTDLLRQKQQENEALFARLAASRFS